MVNKLFVANWKMYLTYQQEIAFIQSNLDELTRMQNLIICPSFVSLVAIKQRAPQVQIGAQDCSWHAQGAYTGQIAAATLHEAGVTYCLVGHSETRSNPQQDLYRMRKKIKLLLEQSITPIVCIGESLEDKAAERTYIKLLSELNDIPQNLLSGCVVAYEPLWAIGSGITPSHQDLQNIVSFFKEHGVQRVLYGGSVSPETKALFNEINNLDGFLIGKASTDFQQLKKIVQ